MTDLERARDDLLGEMADALCKLLVPSLPLSAEAYADEIAHAAERFQVAAEKQHARDTDLPISEDDCQACKGTGIAGKAKAIAESDDGCVLSDTCVDCEVDETCPHKQ